MEKIIQEIEKAKRAYLDQAERLTRILEKGKRKEKTEIISYYQGRIAGSHEAANTLGYIKSLFAN